jgi:hypothetical protein
MNYYRAVRELSAADAAYIAGLVDGEGTVTLTTMHRGENRRLVVSISNTERGLLEFVQAALGAGQITGKPTYNVKHTPSFAFRVTSRQAVELLRQVAPYELKDLQEEMTHSEHASTFLAAEYIRAAAKLEEAIDAVKGPG